MRFVLFLLALGAPLLAQSNAEIRADFNKLAADNAQMVRVSDLPAGLYAVSMGNREGPALLVLGSLRGDEASPAAACLQLARGLLMRPDTARLLERAEVILLPVPNPRGRERLFAKPAIAMPGAALPHDDDRDGTADEDGPADINGDGVVTQMRVRRAGGKYVASEKDARLLVPAKPGQVGEFDVYWEGVDDDADGRINEDPAGTITLSNDWSIRFSDAQPGAARFMMQQPETRALADLILGSPRIYAAYELRAVGGGVAFAKGPPSRGEDPYRRDGELAVMLAKAFGESKSAVPPEPDGAGNIADWLYESAGVLAANVYLASIPPPAKPKDKDEDGEEDSPEMGSETPGRPSRGRSASPEDSDLAWLAYAPGSFRDWKPFKHPQLGDVEIGGWLITSRRDAASVELGDGVERLMLLAKETLASAPRVSVSKLEVQDRGGVYRVRATVYNAGKLDYRNAFAEANRIGLPLFVSLAEAKGIELIGGERRQSRENLAGGATATFEWVVRCNDPKLNLDVLIEATRTGNTRHSQAIEKCDKLTEEE